MHDNACVGILSSTGAGAISSNLVTNNTGATSDGIQVNYDISVVGNTVFGSGRDGIRNLTPYSIGYLWINNLLVNNGGYGSYRAAF